MESKLLEQFQSDNASWRGCGDELLLECGGADCCGSTEELLAHLLHVPHHLFGDAVVDHLHYVPCAC